MLLSVNIGMLCLLWTIILIIPISFFLVFLRRKNKKIIKLEESNHQQTYYIKRHSLLFSKLAEEILNPINCIHPAVEKLVNTKIYHSESVHLIYENSQQLYNLGMQLQNIPKLSDSSYQSDIKKHDFNKHLEEIINIYNVNYAQKKIRIQLQSSFKSKIHIDIEKTLSIIKHILSNIIKTTKENGYIIINAEITNHLEPIHAEDSIKNFSIIRMQNDNSSNFLKLMITETYNSLPNEKIKEIIATYHFDEIASTSFIHFGYGLGAIYVKEIINLLSGKLCVEKTSKNRIKYTLYLPCDKKTIEQSLSSAEILNKRSLSSQKILSASYYEENIESNNDYPEHIKHNIQHSHRKKIYVFSNSKALLDLLTNEMRSKYEIINFDNIYALVNTTLKVKPDMIVADSIKQIGWSYENLKKNPKTSHIPLLLLLPDKSFEQEVQYADDYLLKPFEPKELKFKISKIFRFQNSITKKTATDIALKPSEVVLGDDNKQFFDKLIKAIEDNIENPLFNAGSLVEIMGMSRANLYRKVNELSGYSLKQLIQDTRLVRAKQYLESSQLTVSEIAYKVGYNNVVPFRKAFTKRYNLTPSEYNKKYCILYKEGSILR